MLLCLFTVYCKFGTWFWLLFVCFIVLYDRFILIWIRENITYSNSSSAIIFNNSDNNHSNSDNSDRIDDLSALFLFSNNCFYHTSIIDGLYTSYTLYALYFSTLIVFLNGGTLFTVNFNIVYHCIIYQCDYVSIFDDVSFNTMIIILQFDIIDFFKFMLQIGIAIIHTTIIAFQALQFVITLLVSLFFNVVSNVYCIFQWCSNDCIWRFNVCFQRV